MKPPKILVETFMVTPVYTVLPKMKLWEVTELFIARKISGAPVIDNLDRVISMVSEGTILSLAAKHGLEATIAQCLNELPTADKLVMLQRDNTFEDAYRTFLKHKIHRIPVVDGGNLLRGLISRSTILKMFIEAHYGKKLPNR